MKTLRQELEKLGPERVSQAMVAFEHRHNDEDFHGEMCGGICCFLTHAGGLISETRRELSGPRYDTPITENMFEGWSGSLPTDREKLRQECIIFLAEHGRVAEPTMKPEVQPV